MCVFVGISERQQSAAHKMNAVNFGFDTATPNSNNNKKKKWHEILETFNVRNAVKCSLFYSFFFLFHFRLKMCSIQLFLFLNATDLAVHCCYTRFMIIEYFPNQWNHFVRIVFTTFALQVLAFIWKSRKPKAHHWQAAAADIATVDACADVVLSLSLTNRPHLLVFDWKLACLTSCMD